MKIGDVVQFTDEHAATRAALITHVWSDDMVNLVTVDPDPAKDDPYGRQIERRTSVPRYREGYVGIYFTT